MYLHLSRRVRSKLQTGSGELLRRREVPPSPAVELSRIEAQKSFRINRNPQKEKLDEAEPRRRCPQIRRVSPLEVEYRIVTAVANTKRSRPCSLARHRVPRDRSLRERYA